MKSCRNVFRKLSTLLALVVLVSIVNAVYLCKWYMATEEFYVPLAVTSPTIEPIQTGNRIPLASMAEHNKKLINNHSIVKRNETSYSKKKTTVENGNLTMVKMYPPKAATTTVHHGYVLAGDYWEQQSSACRNLQNLQCWAAKLNLSVVEPSAINSQLRTPLAALTSSRIRFSDLFDIGSWNNASMELGRTELVQWEEFVENAPRKIIYVQFKYSTWDVIRNMSRDVIANPSKHLPKGERHKTGCSIKSYESNFTERHNFTLVRSVCFNFEYGDNILLQDFQKEIYGSLSPHEVTVYFKQWRGMGMHPRVAVQQSGCRNDGLQEKMTPSKEMIASAERYIDEHLNGGNYIAIMARIEKSKISLKSREGVVPFCFTETAKQWKQLSKKTDIQTTFLASDVGKYGSNSFRSTGDGSDLQKVFHRFFKQIYGTSMTVEEWERTFKRETGSTDSGYVALLQKLIVTRSKCVLFVGGGAFQKHALNMYRQLHTDNECISVVKECTDPKNLPML